MTQERLFGIRDLARKYGCSLRTLRFYEERGLLAPLHVGLQRFYSEKDEIKLQLVLHGKLLGLPLQEVQALILAKSKRASSDEVRIDAVASLLPSKKISDQIALLTRQRAGLDAAIAALKTAQMRSATSRDAATLKKTAVA